MTDTARTPDTIVTLAIRCRKAERDRLHAAARWADSIGGTAGFVIRAALEAADRQGDPPARAQAGPPVPPRRARRLTDPRDRTIGRLTRHLEAALERLEAGDPPRGGRTDRVVKAARRALGALAGPEAPTPAPAKIAAPGPAGEAEDPAQAEAPPAGGRKAGAPGW